jgi:hypothetical protein
MGTVYLIGDYSKSGFYKIGVTRGDLNKRLKKLQTGNSGELYVKESFVSSYPFELEKMLHNKHESDKVLSEWYYLEKEQVENFINECKDFQSIIDAMEDNYFFKKKHKKCDK